MRKRKNFYFEESSLEYIEKYRSEHHLPNFTAALTEIIEDHKHRNDIPATKILIEGIAKQVADELSDTLTRIRLGANNADRNSDIIIMLLNTLIASQGFGTFFEDDTPQLVRAREKEKERIATFRQKRLDGAKAKADKEKTDNANLKSDENSMDSIVSVDEIVF
ncbi:MAG TPA: hypothetical protein VHP31_09605 [Caproicibacter sp.]|nr:hypothetical protein [Caproicibacter sp.]